MPRIGADEAKRHLSRLLDQVQRGERFVITRHGHPVAELSPFQGRDPQVIERSIAAMRALRGCLADRGIKLGDLLEEGESVRDAAHGGHSC